MSKKLGIVILIVLIIGFSVIAYKWIYHRLNYITTNAVFVEIDNFTNLSFKRVAGKIKKLFVKEGDIVKKGQILAKLEDKDYKLKLQKLDHEINSLKEKLKALKIKKERITKELSVNLQVSKLKKQQLQSKLKSVQANLSSIDANIHQLLKDEKRFKNLVEKQLAPKRKLEDIQTNLKVLLAKKQSLLAKVEEIKTGLKIIEENIKLAKTKQKQKYELAKNIVSLQEKINSLYKDKQDLQNLIQYTQIKAPFDGKVAKIFKKENEVVSSGMPILSVVPSEGFYINVLLEETKIDGLKIGSKAIIKIDAYPNKTFEGIVEKIMPTTASKFALVPRDITAGEFTKVAQRIPVRIKITKGDISLLKVGLSGEVEIKKVK